MLSAGVYVDLQRFHRSFRAEVNEYVGVPKRQLE